MRLSSSKEGLGEFKTLEGGHILRLPVKHDDLVPLNQPCILAIRPEHVVIKETTDSLPNALIAKVREINFAGATFSVKLDANGLGLEALTLAADGLSAGDRCVATLPPEKISILKNE